MNSTNNRDVGAVHSESSTVDDRDLQQASAPRSANVQRKEFGTYKMDHGNRGYALIFNNREFEDKRLSERRGTDMDLRRMLSVLREYFGFEKDNVKLHHNVKRQRMQELINEAAAKNYESCDCFICVILSYGTKHGGIFGADGAEPITVQELSEPLKGKSFQASGSLRGKPKIFFVQACPCEKDEAEDDYDAVSDDEEFDPDAQGIRIPSEADIFVAWSSIPNSLGRKGSLFIQTLNEVVKTKSTKDDLLSIMTKVNYKIAEQFENKDDAEVPFIKSTLTKKVFFN